MTMRRTLFPFSEHFVTVGWPTTPVLRYSEEPGPPVFDPGLRRTSDAGLVVPKLPSSRTTPRRGYVLLIVLLLLALAAVALAGVCRLTLRRSTAATLALADLQHRWGSVTTQYTLLSNAANVIDRAEGNGPPLPTLHGSFTLGAVRFDVDLCDDQSRANVNALLAWRGPTVAQGMIRDLARAGGSRLAPRLPAAATNKKPLHALSVTADEDAPPDDVPTDRVPPAFGSLTEVFPAATWDDLRPSPASLSSNLTCYGDGKVNLRRASVAVLSAALSTGDTSSLTPPQVNALARIGRAAGNTLDVANALAQTGATAAAVLKLQGRLVDGSNTQSVWIEAHDGRRTWRTWAARDTTDADHPRTFTGAW